MIEKRAFVTALRRALMQLDDLQSLRKSPLLPLATKRNNGGNPIVLQQRLIEAVESLKNAMGVGYTRYYDVLYYRYLEQLNQQDVAFQLGLSVRQLRREQNNAIEYLSNRLWDDFGMEHDLTGYDLQGGIRFTQSATHLQESDLEQEI